jgi:hypothetical protein
MPSSVTRCGGGVGLASSSSRTPMSAAARGSEAPCARGRRGSPGPRARRAASVDVPEAWSPSRLEVAVRVDPDDAHPLHLRDAPDRSERRRLGHNGTRGTWRRGAPRSSSCRASSTPTIPRAAGRSGSPTGVPSRVGTARSPRSFTARPEPDEPSTTRPAKPAALVDLDPEVTSRGTPIDRGSWQGQYGSRCRYLAS